MNRDALRKEIVNFVGEKRLPHVLGTEKECLELAGIFGMSDADREKLAFAALLHDITKSFSPEEHEQFAESRHICLPTANTDSPKTLHAVTGAYMAEIIRGGIISVDSGQKEAAHAIGMTHWQSMIYVVLPQAVRNIMPSIGNEFVVNIKDSSVLNVISVNELFFMSKSAAGTYLRYFEVFFITACIYLVLTFTVTRLLRLLERKMDGKTNYIIYGSQSDSKASIKIEKEEGVPRA